MTPCGTYDLTWDALKIFSVLSEPNDGLLIINAGLGWVTQTFRYPDYSAASIAYLGAIIESWVQPK